MENYVPTNSSTSVTMQPPVVKKQSTWKLKFAIAFLVLLLFTLLGTAGYGGYVGYTTIQQKTLEIDRLKSENDQLKSFQDSSKAEIQQRYDSLQVQVNELQGKNKDLQSALDAAQAKVAQLTPKSIRDLKIDTLKTINRQNGDNWLNPIYVDLTGDDKEDGIFAYQKGGTGAFLYVYVYSYGDSNELRQILGAEQYQEGRVSVAEGNIVEIKSTSGTPDNRQTAVTRFKYDPGQKKMIRL